MLIASTFCRSDHHANRYYARRRSLCIGLGLGSKAIPPRLLFAGIITAMLPDADVLSFKFGVAYGNVFGHRGFTHSLVFAFVVPLLCVLIGRRWFRAGLIRCWLF